MNYGQCSEAFSCSKQKYLSTWDQQVQRLSDYQRGTWVSEYPPIIGHADNQIGVCSSKHIMLSLKTDARFWQGSGNRRL